ncbi:MAG: glycosyltransferase [Rhodospirillales bacterium]|nr:glycosyltransferase [Rhodospirillales bacterium]
MPPEAQRPRVAAIIPVLDEEGALGAVLAAMPADAVDVVIVVDGGSRDRTVDVAQAHGAVVVVQQRRGYGAACAEGAAEARRQGAGLLAFLDGDGGDDPREIPVLLAPLLDGSSDFVIGSRTRGVRERGSMGPHQVLAGRAIGALTGLLYGVRYTDMAALRAIGADTLDRLGLREMTYGWNLEMQMRAAQLGLRIREIPVSHARRIAGRSKVAGTLRGTLKAGSRIIATFWRVARSPR